MMDINCVGKKKWRMVESGGRKKLSEKTKKVYMHPIATLGGRTLKREGAVETKGAEQTENFHMVKLLTQILRRGEEKNSGSEGVIY